MANYLDTGDTGRAVSAESDGALLAGIFGSAKYVLENGSQFKTEVQSNNIVKISDGDAVMYGRHVRIPANDSALVTINNGHSGTNRIDLIVFRYTKDSTGKETVDLAVIQGEDSTGTATAPATIDGDILTGAMQADFPLYRVELNGLNIVSVTAMFDVIGNISQITKTNKDLIDRISKAGTYELLADTKSADYISVPVDFGKYKAYLLMALADSYTRPLASITIPAIYAKINTTPDRTIQCSDGGESNIYAAHMYFEPSTSQIKVRSKNATYCRVRLYGIL